MQFSFQTWQAASLPGNLPLNGSYKHYARSSSTDSLDSSGTGTTSNSSDCGTGHSQQIFMDGSTEATRSFLKTPIVSHNPWQFVKVGPAPLCKEAADRIKLCNTIEAAQNCKKEEEPWQRNLDSWKSRRRKATEKVIQRVEDLKLLDEDENHTQRKSKTKTFSEIVESRAHKPRSYNLSIQVENEGNDLKRINDCERTDEDHVDKNCVLKSRQHSHPTENQKNLRNQNFGPSPTNVERKSFESLQGAEEEHGLGSIMGCGTVSENNSFSSTQQVEPNVKCLLTELNEHQQETSQTDGNDHLAIRLWLNSHNQETDFGFNILEESGIFMVNELKQKSAGQKSGLKLNDQILAINGKTTSGRSRSSLLFSIKQSVYNGYLDLLISRSKNKDATEIGRIHTSDLLNGENNHQPSLAEIFNEDIKYNLNYGGSSGEILNNESRNDFSHGCPNGDVSNIDLREQEPTPLVIKKSNMKTKSLVLTNSEHLTGASISPFAFAMKDHDQEFEKTYISDGLKLSTPNGIKKRVSFPNNISLGFSHEERDVLEESLKCASPVDQNLLSDRPSSTFDTNDAQEKETRKLPESDALPQKPRMHNHFNEKEGLTIVFRSDFLQNQNKLISNGLLKEPASSVVSEENMNPDNDMPKSQRTQEEIPHLEVVEEEVPLTHIENLSEDNYNTCSQENKIKLTEVLEKINSCDLNTEPFKKNPPPPEIPANQMQSFRKPLGDLVRKLPSLIENASTDGEIVTDISPRSELPKVLKTQSTAEHSTRELSEKEQSLGSRSSILQEDSHKKTGPETAVAQKKLLETDNYQDDESQRYKQQLMGTSEKEGDNNASFHEGKEKCLKQREEYISKRKKEIVLELEKLLSEEKELQYEREQFRRQIMFKQREAQDVISSIAGIRPSQV